MGEISIESGEVDDMETVLSVRTKSCITMRTIVIKAARMLTFGLLSPGSLFERFELR